MPRCAIVLPSDNRAAAVVLPSSASVVVPLCRRLKRSYLGDGATMLVIGPVCSAGATFARIGPNIALVGVSTRCCVEAMNCARSRRGSQHKVVPGVNTQSGQSSVCRPVTDATNEGGVEVRDEPVSLRQAATMVV